MTAEELFEQLFEEFADSKPSNHCNPPFFKSARLKGSTTLVVTLLQYTSGLSICIRQGKQRGTGSSVRYLLSISRGVDGSLYLDERQKIQSSVSAIAKFLARAEELEAQLDKEGAKA